MFQDPVTGNYVREDGEPGYACVRCGNGYASAQTRDDIAAHACEALALDLASFEESYGLFREGYTEDDIDALSSRTVEFLCVWNYRDDLGFGGDSEIVGREILPDGSTGNWKPLHPTLWAHLLGDPDDPADPADPADPEGPATNGATGRSARVGRTALLSEEDFVVQAPDVVFDIFDDTGFLLENREISNYRWVTVREGGDVPKRNPSFSAGVSARLSDLAGEPARVLIRIQDPV